MPASRPSWGFRLAPSQWLRLARRVREDPGDVTLGARIFFAVGGHDEGPTHRRFLRSAAGRRLLRDAEPYPPLFGDLEGLRALPDGTLGREYVRQLDERGIDPAELARRTEDAFHGFEFTPEHAYVRDRVRQAHDLFHTLTGYGIDLLGEAGVLAFTFGQTGNKGWAVLVLLNQLTALARGRLDGWAVAWRGYRRGRAARFLPAVEEWDRLLRLPIERTRVELGIEPLPPYRPLALDEVFGQPETASR